MTTDVAVPEPPDGIDDERAVQVAKAYHLHVVQGHTLDDTAKMMGLHRSTVWRYCHLAKAQAALAPWMEREQVRVQHHYERQAMRSALSAHVEVTGLSPLDWIPVVLKIQERAAAEYGLDAAGPMIPGGQRPDPVIIEAIRNYEPEDDQL